MGLRDRQLQPGAWVNTNVNVTAGGMVTTIVDLTGAPNAVLSGVFLG